MTAAHLRPVISREFVVSQRRRRFADVAAADAHEHGLHEVTVASLCKGARASRNTFYELFSSRDKCLAYSVECASEHLFGPVQALGGEGEWLSDVEAAIDGFYAAAAEQPLLAQLFLVHGSGLRRGAHQPDLDAGTACFADLLRSGRAEAERRGFLQVPPLAEEYLSGAIVSLATLRVSQGRTDALAEDGKEMAILVASTYFGPR